eukprot:CAMPEP_0179351078 /NCGR_PEP_ID=MMETSP0797-20121207/75092_1 /TAXON_ID=47934 /ORGANISM="Dinophysis acuminata, Strain DAEP01" /LENGTH=44 /DNA_ID= /DNA_START= /DNA_END= /DNA_ORIENTATION=
MGILTTAVAVLLAAGIGEWSLRSPGFFWTWFHHFPDWMPGKWWL